MSKRRWQYCFVRPELGLCLPSNSSILPRCMFTNDCKSTRIDLGVSEHVNLQTQNLQMKRPDYIWISVGRAIPYKFPQITDCSYWRFIPVKYTRNLLLPNWRLQALTEILSMECCINCKKLSDTVASASWSVSDVTWAQ